MDAGLRALVVADLDSRRNAELHLRTADRVVVDWVGPGTGPFRVRKLGFEFTVDEPLERGGSNTAPNPLAYFLAGAASCLANHYVSLAIVEGVALEGLSISAVGHFDRVLTGGAFRDITYDVRIRSKASAEQIHDLAARADLMCFASNTLANAGVVMQSRLQLNGIPVATLTR